MKLIAEKDTCNAVCVNRTLVARVKKALPQSRAIGEAADMFSVLGDPTRIKIIFSLSREKELCVCDIASILGLTVSAASHQLRKLRDARAVTCRNDGNMVYYSLADKYVEALLYDALKHAVRNGRAAPCCLPGGADSSKKWDNRKYYETIGIRHREHGLPDGGSADTQAPG